MKKYIQIILVVSCTSKFVVAQNYTFTHFTDTYEPIDNGIPLWVDTSWSYLENNTPKQTPIGFTFRFWEFPHTNVIVRNNGTVALKKSTQPGFNDNILVCFTQIKSRTVSNPWLSKIHYTTTGNAPDRVFIVEYNNVGLELSNDTSSYLNFQLWLYETDYSIEVRIGPNNCDSTAWFYSKGPYIGLDTMNTFNGLFLSGNSSSPVLVDSVDAQLSGSPPNGMVYRFVPAPRTGITEKYNLTFSMYPNPATGGQIEVYAPTEISEIYLSDITGRRMTTDVQLNKNYARINTQTLRPGLYLLTVETSSGIASQKLMVGD